MQTSFGACKTVAKGGVGESGASSLLTSTVSGPTSKLMVLKNVNSSLCPNTGAIGLLTVNGSPMAYGNLTGAGGLIQTEAAPGSHVAAVIHTVPLFNGIVCVRLGELSVQLDECELVNAQDNRGDQTAKLITSGVATRDWYAWNNLMPPKPDDFHVVGEVQVANPGVDVLLCAKEPQGFNPRILLLDLLLVQRPGVWPQLLTWKQTRFDKFNVTYDSVQIFHGTTVIATVSVDNVQ